MAGIITRYVYDNQDLLLEYDGTNTLLARYSYGDRLDQPLAMERAGQSFFYQANHQGSVTQITDAAGFVVNSYEYDSYGNIESAVEGIPNPFTYTAREFDAESGLYYYRARYYDAETGRFINEDPIGFAGGFNLYRYVRNNPVKNRDPLGLEVTMVCRGVVVSWNPFKHCFVVVWHWESDPCTGERFRVIDRQYTVGGGQTTAYPQDSPESTFTDDTEAFNAPSPEDFYNIPVPDGMSQQEFDDSVTQTGEAYNAAYSYTGANSNTAADDIIEDSGGVVPDVSGAYNQNWGELGGGW